MVMHYVPAGGLIHVAEFTATVCIAYLGIDALGERETTVRDVAAHIESVSDDLLNRLQPVQDDKLQISFDCDELYMIAHVTRHFLPEPEAPRKKRVVKWARKNCPLLWYFLDRWDLTVVSIICVAALFAFFAISLLEFAEIKVPIEVGLPIHLFFVVCSIWIFITVCASFKIPKLIAVVEKARADLEARLRRLAEENVARSIKEAQKKSLAPGNGRRRRGKPQEV